MTRNIVFSFQHLRPLLVSIREIQQDLPAGLVWYQLRRVQQAARLVLQSNGIISQAGLH